MSKSKAADRREKQALIARHQPPPAPRPKDAAPTLAAEPRLAALGIAPLPSPPTCPPTHRLRPEQFILLELVKAGLHTSDEAQPSAYDTLQQLPDLKRLAREIMGFQL